MFRKQVLIGILFLLPVVSAHPLPGQDEPPSRAVPLFEGLGDYHHPVTTESKLAQRYFDQGLTLVYAFNHAEAIRSFREAARLDPQCAMAYWGVALAFGPNINAPMSEEAALEAYTALQQAQKLAPQARNKEQAYINALAKRYVEKPTEDRSDLDQAYADAMRELSRQYPDDPDAATFFAEALMTTMPWSLWTKDGQPRPGTQEIVDTLESVLKRHPNHPGANHYYIHAIEASPHPERGLASAYRLEDWAPAAGHLVHMPAHIYLRVGDYHRASLANERAIAADEAYIKQYNVAGVYPTMYYPHNVQFLSYSQSIEGRSRDSIEASRKAAKLGQHEHAQEMPMMQLLTTAPILVLARFGKWDDILQQPQPDEKAPYEVAIWHYARGLAFVRQKKPDEAEQELTNLAGIADSAAAQKLDAPFFPGTALIRIARTILAAEVNGLRGDQEKRIRQLEEAVVRQDDLPYLEPPYWYYPVRQSLGAALLEAGQPKKAEAVYREDLRRNPHNGWSLFGLMLSLRAQGKMEEARRVEARFREAWKHSDVPLTASVF